MSASSTPTAFGVSVTPARNGSFDLDVTSAGERSANASTFEPTGPTEPSELGYLNITHSIPNENSSQATVRFRVNRSTMAELESEPEDFSLSRRANGTWESVNTTLERETSGSCVFSGTASGISEWTAAADGPRISVSDATANVTAITTREAVDIRVLLNNTGGSDGRFEVELLLNGSVVERRDVAVAPQTTSTGPARSRPLDVVGSLNRPFVSLRGVVLISRLTVSPYENHV